MISKIYIDGYKCLKQADIETSSINIFVGANACGKSSLLQCMLLLRQSADEHGLVNSLDLSGPLYEAGTVLDILHPEAEHQISMSIEADGEEFKWSFTHDRKQEASSVRSMTVKKPGAIPSILSVSEERFAYLGAERLGPRVSTPLPVEGNDLAGVLGSSGEHTAAYLARSADSSAMVEWKNLAAKATEAAEQLGDRNLSTEFENTQGQLDLFCNVIMDWIIPGFSIKARVLDQADSAALRFERDPSGTRTETRATHVGFGLSYTLPVIVSALSLAPNGVLLIENPEAHLHPYSQSRIGVFLALVAATGRQLFIETHSDHLLNGVRLAASKQLLPTEQARINFFELDEHRSNKHSISTKITPIKMGERGRLSPWPRGFFDQLENDLSNL